METILLGPRGQFDMDNRFEYDFAISYAGSDLKVAQEIHRRLKQKYQDYTVFFAPFEKHMIVGKNGEEFFEGLFSSSKEVIVLLSDAYKAGKWPRFEWDVILERNDENRFIPVKLYDVKILGMPSNVIYIELTDNFDEVVDLCIYKLLSYEQEQEIKRESEYEKTLTALKNPEGALDKAYQLVVDNRKRTPLGDIAVPKLDEVVYEIISTEDLSYSTLKRLQTRVKFRTGFDRETIRNNIHHCMAVTFNSEKPDALSLMAYCPDSPGFYGFDSVFNVARVTFAPYGKWERAEEGFAYNLPVTKFDFKFDLSKQYFR